MLVKVLSDINTGQYKSGETVDFPEAEAKELIAAGAAKAMDADDHQPTPESGESADEQVPAPPAPDAGDGDSDEGSDQDDDHQPTPEEVAAAAAAAE